MNTEDKLELLRYLIFIRGKIQHLSMELLVQGQDTGEVDAREKKLAVQIDTLRGQVMDDWSADAAQVMSDLRALNEQVQTAIRDLRASTDKAEKISRVVQLLDKGLAEVARLIA